MRFKPKKLYFKFDIHQIYVSYKFVIILNSFLYLHLLVVIYTSLIKSAMMDEMLKNKIIYFEIIIIAYQNIHPRMKEIVNINETFFDYCKTKCGKNSALSLINSRNSSILFKNVVQNTVAVHGNCYCNIIIELFWHQLVVIRIF